MLLAAVFITSAAAAEPCQVGVGILQNASQAITGVAARDHLLALLTDEQVVGVPLNAPVPDESMGLEAHRKGCRLLVISWLAELAGQGVTPSVSVCIDPPPNDPTRIQLSNALVADLNQPGSGVSAHIGPGGCFYQIRLTDVIDTTSGGFVYNKRALFQLWPVGESQPLIGNGVAMALLTNYGDKATPEMLAGLARQIAQQAHSRIAREQSRLSKAAGASAGIMYNIIDTTNVSSVAGGLVKGDDRGGSPEKAVWLAIGQLAKSVAEDLQKTAKK